jgi:RNA polymerase sigma-70 factor, ECF subfamily
MGEHERSLEQGTKSVEEFMSLYTRHQRGLFTYILSLVTNVNDAEELLQQTNLILWRKFGEFHRGSNFGAWASRVAYLEVLKYFELRKNRAQSLDPRLFEAVAEKMLEHEEYFERRTDALNACLEKLRKPDRQLLMLRYAPGASTKSVASKLQRSVSSVYKTTSKIRQMLLDCVFQRLREEKEE